MKILLYCSLILTLALATSCEQDFDENPIDSVVETGKEHKRTCNSDAHQSRLLEDPEYKIRFDKRMDKLQAQVKTRSAADCSNPTILPLAIHFQGINNTDRACLTTLALRQLEIINADFQALNADVSNWSNVSSEFPNVNPGSSCLKFCLADKNHPSGFGLSDGDLAITINQINGDFSSEWSGYINVFIQPDLGFLGYSPLGGLGNGDGVVIDASAFGEGTQCGGVTPQAPYNLGRTLTHELGHYLALDHLWGEGGCGSDDGIADTPIQEGPNYGCPSVGASSCSSNDLFMNYMDYGDDACIYMFSENQADVMYNYVVANFQSLINSDRVSCSEGNEDDNNQDDIDGDGIPNLIDNCPSTPNPDQTDENNNGIGDACENQEPQDTDGDGVSDNLDNCVNVPNPNQEDTNNNGIGDACEDTSDDGNCQGYNITLTINPDDYPEEITWIVRNSDSGKVEHEGGGYEFDENNPTIVEALCLSNGCYEIIIQDSYGDGICCDYGDGNFHLSNAEGNIFYTSDGQYGNREKILLCVQTNKLKRLTSVKARKRENLKKKESRKR